jgi:signal transduction histidine kinase
VTALAPASFQAPPSAARAAAQQALPELSGPYVTLATVAALALLYHMVPGLPDPAPVVLMAVVYAAFAGGLRSGLASAAIALAYVLGSASLPGTVLAFAPGEVPRVVLLGLTIPAMAVLVARLQERAQRARASEAEQLRLRELDKLKTQFLNNAAHELRTPLTPIVLQLRMLRTSQEGAPLSEKQRHAMDMLDRNIRRLNALVQDLLEVAKLQAGQLRLSRRLVDLDHVVGEAVESFREPAAEAGVVLDFRPSGGAVVEADAKRLLQVLFNLLTNALKFTARGGTIAVEVQARDDGAEVRVRDTGPGLAAEQLGRLFQPFQMAHDPERGPAGSGLGLFICRGIVEQHGGRIWAASEGPGKGTTFAFALPAAASPPSGAEADLARLV